LITDTATRPTRVLILTGDVDSNIGDQAILRATCEDLRRIRPNVRISVVSAAAAKLRIDAGFIQPGPRGFFRLCREAASSDLVLCGGGGLFQEDDSRVKMPYWALRVWLVRLLCKRVIGYSLGVGPLESKTGRFAARVAFSAMERVSARDPLGQKIAQSLTSKSVTLVPDPALHLVKTNGQAVRNYLKAQGVPLSAPYLIGVAVRRWYPPQRRFLPQKIRTRLGGGRSVLTDESKRLAAMLAEVLDELVRRLRAHILLMPSYCAPHEADPMMAHEIIARMEQTGAQLLYVDDPALYKGVASEVSLMIGGRMHPTILAASSGTPVVGLAYNQKFQGLFQMLGIGDQLMDVVDFVQGTKISELTDMASAAMVGPNDCLQRAVALGAQTQEFNRLLLDESG
jgi:polysaccharide pyruvyl transferase WcaK-like protein